MDDKFKDYYKILGVTPRASFENIRSAAEHELSQNWNNAMGRLEIQEAYEVLSDLEKRKEYDEEFNRRLNERELAIRNARTFEEYIAATSLHSELAHVDVAPEVEISEEEIDKLENNTDNTQDISETSGLVGGDQQEEATIDSLVGNDSGSSSEDVESSQDNEEEIDENEEIDEQSFEEEAKEEQLEEEKLEEEKLEEEKLEEEQPKEQPEEEQEIQVSDQEETANNQKEQEFINIPIKRIEKEIEQQQLNEPVEEEVDELDNEPIISKAAARELIRAAIIAGGVGVGALVIGGVPGVVLGLMAGVATGDFFKKHADKIKIERKPSFQKEAKTIEVTEINTEETQFLNECAEKLENQIYDLLDKPSKNYELEIAIRKYENLIEITEKRIEFKESEKANSVLKKLEVKALEDELKKLEHKLKRLNNTLKQLKSKREMQTEKKDPRLSRLNQKLSDISYQTLAIENDQIEEKMTKEQKEEKLDDLSVEKSRLLQKRDAKANRLYVNKDFISLGQVTLVKLNSAMNIVRSTVNKFTDLNSDEQLEESSEKFL